jgi:hypothetical protein
MATLRVLIVGVFVVAGPILFGAAQDQKPEAGGGSWVVLQQGLNKDAPRYEIALSLNESRPGQFGSQPIEKAFRPLDPPENGYTHRVDFDPTPAGVQTSFLLRPAKEIEWLGREDYSGMSLFRVAVLQGRDANDLKTIKEGYTSMGQSFSLPVEIPTAQLNLPTKQPVRGSMEFRFDTVRAGTFRGFLSLVLNATLTGSVMTDSAKLDVTMECSASKRIEDRQIMIQVTPFDKRLRPDTASGKISDIITLQTSRLVVEKIAPDFSRISLAAVYGRVGERSPEEMADQSRGIAAQRPLPRFTRVDLIRRRLIGLDDLCAEAGDAGRIVLIFGDRLPENAAMYAGPEGRPGSPLPLEEDLILKTLNSGVEKPVVLVFVSRRFDPTTLYDRWLGKEPTFHVISDFSQPSYALSRSQPAYYSRSGPGGTAQVETLRGKFALPEDKVSVVLVDGKGMVLHVEPDAQDKLERVLTAINEMIRGLTPSSDPNLPAPTVPVPATGAGRATRGS